MSSDPPLRHWVSRVAFRVYMVVLIALCVLAALELVRGNVLAAAAAAVAVATSVGNPLLALGAVVVAVLLGDYAVAGLAAGAILCHRVSVTAGWYLARREPKPVDLAREFTALPAGLRLALRELAGAGALTTRHIVMLASAPEPDRWRALLGEDPGAASFDGPVIDCGEDGPCSQFACESAGLAGAIAAGTSRGLDVRLLVSAAAFLPQSAAGAWISDVHALVSTRERLDLDQVAQIAAGFSRSPGGRGLMRRAEIAATLDPETAAGLSREQLSSLSRKQLIALQATPRLALLYALVSVGLALPFSLVKALKARWGSRAGPSTSPSTATPTPQAPEEVAVARPKPPPAPVRPRRARALDGWRAWPAPERFLWLLGRPALGVGAIAIAVLVERCDWPIGVAVALAAGLMALRLRVLSLIAALAVIAFAPLAGAVLAFRALLTEGILWRLGRGVPGAGSARRRGLTRVIGARAALAAWAGGKNAADLGQARNAFADALAGGDEIKTLDAVVAHLLSAWAHAQRREAIRVALRAAKGTVFGTWSTDAGPVTFAELRRLHFIQALAVWIIRWSVVVAAAVVAGLLLTPGNGPLAPGGTGAHVALALAVLVLAAPLSAPRLSPSALVLGGVLCWLLAGSRLPSAAAYSALAGIAVFLLRSRIGQLLAVGRARWRDWPPPSGTGRRQRQHWRAAAQALADGRIAIGIEMLGQLAESEVASVALTGAALGRVALVEVERGNLEQAAALLDRMPQQQGVTAASATVAAGILSAALGDVDGAIVQLSAALEQLPEGSPLGARAALALADVLGRAERPQEAMAILSRRNSRILALHGLDLLLDGEVTIASALAARGDRAGARERLKEVLGPLRSEPLYGGAVRQRVTLAEARGLILAGDLALQDEDHEDAEPVLARAVDLLGSDGEAGLKGAALVLHGVSLVGLGEHADGVSNLRAGLDQLEHRRVALRAGERRSAMILASRRLYDWALGALASAQRGGVTEAGLAGAILIESLRRSAVAEGLREEGLLRDPGTLALTEQISKGEREGANVDRLRAELAAQVSSRFARAYLPTPVTHSHLLSLARVHGCVLMFYLPPDAISGWRAWITASGQTHVEPVVLDADSSAMLEQARGQNRFFGVLTDSPIFEESATWAKLGAALIPQGIAALSAKASRESPMRLLIVTDGVLSLVPWAALEVNGRPLVERAVLQLAPALELAGERDAPAPARSASIVAHVGSGDELDTVAQSTTVRPTSTQQEFLAALSDPAVGGAYVGAHGSERGLAQHVRFSDGTTLSAASALAHRWPRWTVLASCLVGQVSQTAGSEPLGLAVSCILGGADTVIASVIEITDAGASELCPAIAFALGDGRDPAVSLREAQLAYLSRHALACVADCLGLVCISTLAPERETGAATEQARAADAAISESSSASGSLPWRFTR